MMRFFDSSLPFVLSVITDRRSVTKSKDDQKTVSFDFGALRLRSGRTVLKKLQVAARAGGAFQ